MIAVSLAQFLIGLGTTATVWAGKEFALFHAQKAQAAQEQILDRKVYCKPVTELPDDMPQWKRDMLTRECEGLMRYLNGGTLDLPVVPIPNGTPAPVLPIPNGAPGDVMPIPNSIGGAQ